jgi:glycosyltransferase involved in cell wall biosynthesis
MRIGFDAKRAFYNRSGLGNYSRDTIRSLHQLFPEHEYFQYTPGITNSPAWQSSNQNLHICTPSSFYSKMGKAFWRSFMLNGQLKTDRIEVFHGLSNELPNNIKKSGIKSVVTIHDLIFMRHPEWYKPVDRMIYRKKFFYSSHIADRVVAVSQQTKSDLISFFGIEEQKIQVIYQGCDAAFKTTADAKEKQLIHDKWNLPAEYVLYVGMVEERKNLLNIVKAIHQAKIMIPLIVIGRQTTYAGKVHDYIRAQAMKHIYFLDEVPVTDLPGIYQMASVFIYPSLFEGFGIPVLEALYSGVPVITSKGGCFSEVGGEKSIYIDPVNLEEIGSALKKVLSDSKQREDMKNAGYSHAQQFSGENNAKQLMTLYTELTNG